MPGITYKMQCKLALNAIKKHAERLKWLMSNPEKIQLDTTVEKSTDAIIQMVKVINEKIDRKELTWRGMK